MQELPVEGRGKVGSDQREGLSPAQIPQRETLPPPPATPQPAPACTHSAVGWGRPQGGSLKKLRLDWRSFTQEFWIPAASEVLAVSRQ